MNLSNIKLLYINQPKLWRHIRLLIARAEKHHAIAESLIPLATKTVCEIGKDAAIQLSSVPLSNDTMNHRIEAMSNDM